MTINPIFSLNEKLASRKLLDGTVSLTYGELEKRCRQIHSFFAAAGLKPGDRIGIASSDETETSALILSCLRLGYPLAVIDPGARKSEADAILQKLQLKALLIDSHLVDGWPENAATHVWPIAMQKKKLLNRLLSKKESAPMTYPDCLPPEGEETSSIPEADGPALFLCTSGTTGLPKILQLSLSNLMAAAKTTSEKLALNQNSRILNLLPLTHYDGIISGLFTALFTSATQIRLGPFSVALLPDIFDAIYKHRATHLLLTPSILALMLRLGEEMQSAFHSLEFKFVISVAATLPPKLWMDFQDKTGKRVVNVYGLSETGNNLFAGPDDNSYRIGSIGKPVDCKVLIVNDAGEEAVVGETGELLLQGPSITSGYLGESLVTRDIGGSSWFATGDLAQVDESGIYWLVGRKKNIIIVGGRNVYPDEINNALLLHPSVMEAATVGAPDQIWGERVVSFVVGRNSVTSQSLMEHAARFLTDYKAPREIHLVSEFPKGRSGKVLNAELLAKLADGTLKSKETIQQGLEDRILELASESFRMPASELSMATAPQNCSKWDSVAHMDLVVNLEKTFGVELLPREVIRITTLELAAQVIREKLLGK